MDVAKTYINHTLTAQEYGKQMYDKQVKAIFADVQVQSRILKYTVREFMPYSIDKIISCINDVKISEDTVDPTSTYGRVRLENNEDYSEGEGTLFYDVRSRVTVPDELQEIEILINIEAQRSILFTELKYHIENRMSYYLARMISAQKNAEFFHSDYDSIKKVKSIWICLVGSKEPCGVEEFTFNKSVIEGAASDISAPQLMTGIIIRIHQNENLSESKSEVIEILENLIAMVDNKEKLDVLEKKHGFVMTGNSLEKEEKDMCNFSQAVEDRAMQKGMEKGISSVVLKMIIQGHPDSFIRTWVTEDELSDEKLRALRAEVQTNQ